MRCSPFLGRFLLFVLVPVAVLFLAMGIAFKRSVPDVSGEIELSGLRRSVRIVRDEWGVPDIQAQNDHDDPDLKSRSSVAGTSALERFTSQLQSRLLGQLLDNISTGNTGSLSTDSFIVNVIDDSGALSIEVTDRVTGEISEIQVNGLNP